MLTVQEAHQIWAEHSNFYAVGWLCLPKSDADLVVVYDSNHRTEVDAEFDRWWGNKDYDCGDAADTARMMAKEAFIHGIACGRQGLVI